MSRIRYFPNAFVDFVPGSTVQIAKARWKKEAEAKIETILENMLPNLDTCDGGVYVGNAGVAYMLYYLASNDAFAHKKQEYLQRALEYVGVSLKFASSRHCRDPGTSFILGAAGVYAVGCLIYKALHNEAMINEWAKKYASFSSDCLKPNFCKYGCDELFVGRAGYLCGLLNLHRRLGRQVVSDDVIKSLCSITVQSGRDYARRTKSPSPLMYAYHKTEYLGAAHGLCSILQMLLSFPVFLKADPVAELDVHRSVDFILSLEQPDYNYAPAMDEVCGSYQRPENEELVHWCHGAPGILYLFARAYKVWADEKYLQACIRCGELTWNKGLLRKGPGICHGVAGSGYVFLLLYRLTEDPKHLYRAQKFAEFMLTPEFQSGSRTPDSPFSLYEGWAGTVCFFGDLIQPEKAEFPFFDIFDTAYKGPSHRKE